MIDKNSQPQKAEQLKRFAFFNVETVQEKVNDAASHPMTFGDLAIKDIRSIYPRLYILQAADKNSVYVFTNQIIGDFKPHTDVTFMIEASSKMEGGILITYGQDSEAQMKSTYIKLWEVSNVVDYSKIVEKKKFLVGTSGYPELSISCMHVLRDLTTMAVGTKKGSILIYESKNLLVNDFKQATKPLEKKQIKNIKISRRSNEIDIYFSTEDAFYWLQNMSEKRKITPQDIEAMDLTDKGTAICCTRNDRKTIVEYDLSRPLKNWQYDGQKLMLRCFKDNYLVILTIERKTEGKNDKSNDRYCVQVFDTLNYYIAYLETFSKIEFVVTGYDNIFVIHRNSKDERVLLKLTEKENAFKIQTFFKKSYFNEAWRFAKNQNSDPSLLAEISRLHGDLLYSKSDFPGAIKQYIQTLGYIEPSYVIRRFLDVSQIEYLIEYLESIHSKKIAKREHTALLLNCYVKQQKIDNLSNFLSESSVESDLFDIQTAIKVCRQLNHTDLAIKLAEQKHQHEYYLKILIEDKKDYDKAVDYIRVKVELEEKEKYVLEFGQQLMRSVDKKLIELIHLLVKAHAISIRLKDRDAVLREDDKEVLRALNFNEENAGEVLTTITFKKPDEFLRLFLVNNEDLENFLLFLLRIPKLPNQQAIEHRLFEFYLEKILQIKNSAKPGFEQQIMEYQQKIMDNLESHERKYDKDHLLVLFKMYEFEQGIIELCKKLEKRDDLLNFYITKKKDNEIIRLCERYGSEEVNLWIHALKYFTKKENKREAFIPNILAQLEKIETLSPLLILSILSKNDKIQYSYIKNFFLNKLRADRNSINKDRETVAMNTKKAEESRAEYKKLKTTAKVFQSTHCMQCKNNLSFPSIHFMCGHSYHQNCLGSERECLEKKCGFETRTMIERKERFDEERNDNKKFFEELRNTNNPFEVVSRFMGKGLFPKQF